MHASQTGIVTDQPRLIESFIGHHPVPVSPGLRRIIACKKKKSCDEGFYQLRMSTNLLPKKHTKTKHEQNYLKMSACSLQMEVDKSKHLNEISVVSVLYLGYSFFLELVQEVKRLIVMESVSGLCVFHTSLIL